MKKDIADKWIVALRSGKYEQGENHLCKNNQWCCLGVLCDIYVDETNRECTTNHTMPNGDELLEFYRESELLPPQVMEWAQMGSANGLVSFGKTIDGEYSLTELNDGGHSFKELADYIEDDWELL